MNDYPTRKPLKANELKRGDVFRCAAWPKGEWCVCLEPGVDARGSTIPSDLPYKDTFWEVAVCGWDPERKALSDGGPYIGVGMREGCYLDLNAGGIATNQLNYSERRKTHAHS